ncbi:MAG: type IX secretion system membrane protein PorP/SprF [Chitinophagia bacterium]|nr:type IX secretion system membrane protein PorP/SprF [Chitinophagia bacterium]
MKAKHIIAGLGLAAMALTAPAVFAQDVHFTQFDMQPLVINPAFTGMFYGKVRANAIYRKQWASVTVPYITYGASADLPIKAEDNGYLAGGIQVYKDQAGDANLSNFTGLVSLAYHKTFGLGDDYKGSDLAVGLQAGYAQKSIDLSKLIFGDEFNGSTYSQGTTGEFGKGLGNNINYYLVNAGVSYAHAFNEKFSFVIGAGANNINKPTDALLKTNGSDAVLDMRITGELGINWKVGDRLSMRPAVLYQSQAGATEMIFGNEFFYALTSQYGDVHFTPAVFLGGWMRGGDATMLTAGFEVSNFRVGLGYDYNTSALNSVSNGQGGVELAVRYINPYTVIRRRTIPCTRF